MSDMDRLGVRATIMQQVAQERARETYIRRDQTRRICAWLEGRTGYDGGLTSADDVREAILEKFGDGS